MIKEALGLAMTINPEYATAAEIARVLRFPSAIKINTFAKGRVEMLKFKIPQDSSLVGMTMLEIAPKLKVMIHPRNIYQVSMDGRKVEHETVRSVNVYLVSYIFLFALSLLLISTDGFDFQTNFSGVATTMNNVGPGFNLVGPTGNFSIFTPFSKVVLIIDMIAGRLELFPLLLLLSPSTWKK